MHENHMISNNLQKEIVGNKSSKKSCQKIVKRHRQKTPSKQSVQKITKQIVTISLRKNDINATRDADAASTGMIIETL